MKTHHLVRYLSRTKVCSKSIHHRRNSQLTHSCHVGEMNNRTFVGDIQVSDLAPENRTFVQTQEATTVFRHLYKHRRRHYNVTVTWRHYYIRPVFPRHDKWRGTDDDHYLYSPSSDILMGAIFSSAATSDASRLPLQNIGGLKRWTMEYNLNNKRSGDKSGMGNSGKTIVHTNHSTLYYLGQSGPSAIWDKSRHLKITIN